MKIMHAPPLPQIPWTNMQYWYTMSVPMDTGVYPVQVYAPRLIARMHIEIPVDGIERPVHVPEAGVLETLFVMGIVLGLVVLWRRAK